MVKNRFEREITQELQRSYTDMKESMVPLNWSQCSMMQYKVYDLLFESGLYNMVDAKIKWRIANYIVGDKSNIEEKEMLNPNHDMYYNTSR